MPRFRLAALAPFALVLSALAAHAQNNLHSQIVAIAAQAHGKVGVACALPGNPPNQQLDCNLNAAGPLPMQSVYKLPIAMAALHAVEAGRLSLQQTIRFVPSDLVARDGYSPLRDQHPHGPVTETIQDLLRRAMVDSDNVASDVLLHATGGPTAVDAWLTSIGFRDIHVRDTENAEDHDEHLQYRNTAPPQALAALLVRLAGPSPLTPAHTRMLLRWMAASHTGDHRLAALLPPGTVIAGKTGTCGQYRPTMNATNDIALITLPNGRRLAIAVLVTDARAPFAIRQRVIAQIARAVVHAAQ